MNKPFVIFNPVARGEKSQRARKFLEAKAGQQLTLAETAIGGDAKFLAAQAVRDGYEIVVAAGGDGTINEAANGIGRSGTALAVLPLGTVNVFARELGIPNDLEAAWRIVQRGTIRTIDLARAQANGTERYFVQLAGVGFDARAIQQASWELKKKIGPLSYVWAGLKTAGRPSGPVEVSWNGAGAHACGPVVLIGNGRFYGGTFAVFPMAALDDGRLDVCVFEDAGYLDMLRYFHGVVRGTHPRLRNVRYFQAEEFVCSGPARIGTPFELDGEVAGESPVRFTVLPRALRVMVPN
jgi:diacylglycerol kinase (ATP)